MRIKISQEVKDNISRDENFRGMRQITDEKYSCNKKSGWARKNILPHNDRTFGQKIQKVKTNNPKKTVQ